MTKKQFKYLINDNINNHQKLAVIKLAYDFRKKSVEEFVGMKQIFDFININKLMESERKSRKEGVEALYNLIKGNNNIHKCEWCKHPVNYDKTDVCNHCHISIFSDKPIDIFTNQIVIDFKKKSKTSLKDTNQVICNQCGSEKEETIEGICSHCGKFGKNSNNQSKPINDWILGL